MQTLWLGYDGLDLPLNEIVAVLHYQPALDGLISLAYGHVPRGIQAVVVTSAGSYLPTRWQADQLRRRWAAMRGGDHDGYGQL